MDSRFLGKMDLDWVESAADPLFGRLSRDERRVLYLTFTREMILA
jgi:hypothetical protein